MYVKLAEHQASVKYDNIQPSVKMVSDIGLNEIYIYSIAPST